MSVAVLSKLKPVAAGLMVAGYLWLGLFPVHRAAAQPAMAAPMVFVDAAAQAFLVALAARRSAGTAPKSADVVVLVLDTKMIVHLVVIDRARGKKYWGFLTLEGLNEILNRLGLPA